jgi:hypothetical protein
MTAGRTVNSLSHHWGTPLHYVEAVKKVFCVKKIDLDPCSNKYSLVNAKTEYKLADKDGLIESWNFKTIYVNPPYGSDKIRKTSIKHWLKKCHETHQIFNSEILALIPVATNTSHWKKYVWVSASAIAFLSDTRLKFLVNGKGGGKGAPMSCAMVYWGQNKNRFFEVFSSYGAIVDTDLNKRHNLYLAKSDRNTEFDNYPLQLVV